MRMAKVELEPWELHYLLHRIPVDTEDEDILGLEKKLRDAMEAQ